MTAPTPSDVAQAQEPTLQVTAFVCGPSRPGCVCRCPNVCEHQWNGEWLTETLPSGATTSTQTCSRCGIRAWDHDQWVLP
jgi:hypothetical protein